jgi:HEPN domain-containing protein
MNEASATQWLERAWHNLSTAQLLYNADHYTDIIAVELHYCCEKSLKAFLAYENKRILKTHDLVDIYDLVKDYINLKDDLDLLEQISTYHIAQTYPPFNRVLPSKEDIMVTLKFSQNLFEDVCNKLNIDKESLK